MHFFNIYDSRNFTKLCYRELGIPMSMLRKQKMDNFVIFRQMEGDESPKNNVYGIAF